jgi:hypothetical protein
VKEIHHLLEDAGREEIPIQPDATQFPDIPLRLGTTVQGGLEFVIPVVQRLVAR